MKRPSRHLSSAQRAGLAVVGLAVLVILLDAAGFQLGAGTVEIVTAALWVIGGSAGATASVSAGRDVASAWTRRASPDPYPPNDGRPE